LIVLIMSTILSETKVTPLKISTNPSSSHVRGPSWGARNILYGFPWRID
jgi:hypothetical protein